jgi:hypothetical protein
MLRTVLKLLLWLVALITACTFAVLFWMGVMQPVRVSERADGPFLFVYREMGNFDPTKIGDITTELDRVLAGAGVTQRRPLGVFFPDEHAEIGYSVAGVSRAKLDSLPGSPKVREIAKQQYLISRFPYRNQASYVVGFLKVEKMFEQYRAEHGYKKVEAMAASDSTWITFMQPVVKE